MTRNARQRRAGAGPPRRVPACALGLGLLLFLAACVDHGGGGGGGGAPPEATRPSGASVAGSILGSWTLTSSSGCTETLVFREDGRFLHGADVTLGGSGLQTVVTGVYRGGSAPDSNGEFSLALTPDVAARPSALAYCGEWGESTRNTLPLAALAQSGPFDPRQLSYRTVRLADGTVVWVGTDGALADRFALARQGNTLRGFAPDESLQGAPLFHREPPDLATTLGALGQVQVIHLPQQFFMRSFAAQPGWPTFSQLALSLHSAVEVTFSRLPDPVHPLCTVVAWGAADFIGPALDPNPLADVATQPTRTLNPGAVAPPLLTYAATVDGQPTLLYLLPIQVESSGGEACELNIRARPLVARLAAAHLASPGGDLFTVPLDGGPAYLPSWPNGLSGLPRQISLRDGGLWRTLHLSDAVYQLPSSPGDALGLRASAGAGVRLTVHSQGQQTYLSIVGAGEQSLGPFLPHLPPADRTALAVPGAAVVQLREAGALAVYRLEVASATVVELSTSGGVKTTGTLRDDQGAVLARGSGGAADGAGFRIVRSLAAGVYELTAAAAALPADFTLHVETPPTLGVADRRLAACLIEATAPGADPATLREADCSHREIASLAGGEAYPRLEVLQLNDNQVADLAPLAGLPRLRALSLAGNPLGDLAPLAQLSRLHRLSLGHTSLDAAALAFLPSLAPRLTYLDLSSSAGLTADRLARLKADLANTLLIAPDGTVLE